MRLNLKTWVTGLIALFCLAIAVPSFAQDKTAKAPKTEKESKVVIIKKTIDENGKVHVEKIIKTGDEAEEFSLEHEGGGIIHIDEDHNHGHDVKIEKKVRVIIDGEDDEANKERKSVMIIKTEKDDNFRKEIKEQMRSANAGNGVCKGSIKISVVKDGEKDEIDIDISKLGDLEELDGQLEGLEERLKQLDIDLGNLEGLDNLDIDIESNSFNNEDCILFFQTPGCKKADTDDKPFLGIKMKQENDVVTLIEVIEGSAAQDAGLKAGDRIVKIGDSEISDIPSLLDAMGTYKVGDNAAITYERDGETKTVNTTLKKRPAETFSYKKEWKSNSKHHEHFGKMWRHYGDDANFDPCKKLEELRGAPLLGVYINTGVSTSEGAVVTDIIKKTGAQKAKLAEGDVITKINQATVNNYDDLSHAIGKYQPGDKVRVAFVRGGKTMKTRATLSSTADTKPYRIKVYEQMCEELEKENAPEPEVIEETVEPTEEPKKEANKLVTEPSSTLDVYPNPAESFVNLEFKGSTEPMTISVVGVDGKEVLREEIKEFSGLYQKQIDLSKYAGGVYIVNVSQGKDTISKQVVLKK